MEITPGGKWFSSLTGPLRTAYTGSFLRALDGFRHAPIRRPGCSSPNAPRLFAPERHAAPGAG